MVSTFRKYEDCSWHTPSEKELYSSKLPMLKFKRI